MADTPFLIGVTGHRDLAPGQEERIIAELGDFFGELKRHLPNTEIRVMTGMADGADRLAATVALEQGLKVDAVLPMPLGLYEQDFSAESAQALEALLERPGVKQIELPIPQGVDRELAGAPGPERDKLYDNLARHLIRKSSLVLALWDGLDNGLVAGTSDVLFRFLEARAEGRHEAGEVTLLDGAELKASGPEYAYWVPVTREGARAVGDLSGASYISGSLGLRTLARHQEVPGPMQGQLKELDSYNAQLKQLKQSRPVADSGGLLADYPDYGELPNFEALEAIDAEYTKADALAMHNQGQSDRMFKIFALMAASMGFLFLVYAKISAEEIFLILYLALFILGMVLLWWARRSRWFSKHLMYRVIAESMRTKFYLALAGVDRLVDVQQLIRLTGIDQFSGFSWVMTVFKDVEPGAAAERMPDAALSRTVGFVHKEWIDGQASYFKRKSAQLSERHHRLERIKNLLLLILVLATLALLFFKGYLKPYLFPGISLKTSLVFLMGLLPVWLGVWELYQNQMATKELLWQYRNQAERFSRTALQLSRTEGWRHQQPILAELGQRSLVENFLWTIHRYHRDFEPPVAA